jgi:hypothetical protein
MEVLIDMARKRNRLLVPEAREALDALMKQTSHSTARGTPDPESRTEVVQQVAHGLGIAYQPNGNNGSLTTREAGRIGGQIGGTMVQRLIAIAKSEMQKAPSPRQPPSSLH